MNASSCRLILLGIKQVCSYVPVQGIRGSNLVKIVAVPKTLHIVFSLRHREATSHFSLPDPDIGTRNENFWAKSLNLYFRIIYTSLDYTCAPLIVRVLKTARYLFPACTKGCPYFNQHHGHPTV